MSIVLWRTCSSGRTYDGQAMSSGCPLRGYQSKYYSRNYPLAKEGLVVHGFATRTRSRGTLSGGKIETKTWTTAAGQRAGMENSCKVKMKAVIVASATDSYYYYCCLVKLCWKFKLLQFLISNWRIFPMLFFFRFYFLLTATTNNNNWTVNYIRVCVGALVLLTRFWKLVAR